MAKKAVICGNYEGKMFNTKNDLSCFATVKIHCQSHPRRRFLLFCSSASASSLFLTSTFLFAVDNHLAAFVCHAFSLSRIFFSVA
mmetsp:Transcript_36930/g.47464  ORF Transcript_36930/g.47464 Transcript_36930/m.47464 type:complete len:85 (-) Transcript_36930:360-614(-)